MRTVPRQEPHFSFRIAESDQVLREDAEPHRVRSPALAARERVRQATRTAGRARPSVCLALFGKAYRFLLLIT